MMRADLPADVPDYQASCEAGSHALRGGSSPGRFLIGVGGVYGSTKLILASSFKGVRRRSFCDDC